MSVTIYTKRRAITLQKNSCAVLVNLDTGKLIAILKKRTQEELRKTLTGWGKEVLEQIEEVSIDLWLPYKNLVKELMPSAEVVADRFHVMKQIGSSRLCVIIFAYVRLNAYWARLLGLF